MRRSAEDGPPEERSLAFVYILRCRDGSLYTGAAKDLAARVRQHQAGRASRYTRARRPLELVWSRVVRGWGRALRVEHRIKRLTRREKLQLVACAAPVRPRVRSRKVARG